MSTRSPRLLLIDSDGFSPNAAATGLPALHYPARDEDRGVTADAIERRFEAAGWEPAWRCVCVPVKRLSPSYGMYHRCHYHSTTHEALGVRRCAGRC